MKKNNTYTQNKMAFVHQMPEFRSAKNFQDGLTYNTPRGPLVWNAKTQRFFLRTKRKRA